MFEIKDEFYFFTGCYARWFGDYEMKLTETKKIQVAYDRVIIPQERPSQIFRVEEKLRDKDYNDFLLEIWTGDRPGWIINSKADLLFYGIKKPKKCYVIGLRTLKEEFCAHYKEWLERYPIKKTYNQWAGYSTEFMLIPWGDLEQITMVDLILPSAQIERQ